MPWRSFVRQIDRELGPCRFVSVETIEALSCNEVFELALPVGILCIDVLHLAHTMLALYSTWNSNSNPYEICSINLFGRHRSRYKLIESILLTPSLFSSWWLRIQEDAEPKSRFLSMAWSKNSACSSTPSLYKLLPRENSLLYPSFPVHSSSSFLTLQARGANNLNFMKSQQNCTQLLRHCLISCINEPMAFMSLRSL